MNGQFWRHHIHRYLVRDHEISLAADGSSHVNVAELRSSGGR